MAELAELLSHDRSQNPSNYAVVLISEGATLAHVSLEPPKDFFTNVDTKLLEFLNCADRPMSTRVVSIIFFLPNDIFCSKF